jgi:ribosomal protein S18 acetylase RimI-like enzyme
MRGKGSGVWRRATEAVSDSTSIPRADDMIVVRPEGPDDGPGIQAVDAAATATLRQTYRPNQRALANRARLTAHLSRLVATVDDRVVGTVQYYVEHESVSIIGLGVHPGFRRRGIASELILSLEEIGRREGGMRLHLHTVKETGNVEVFRHLGFIVIAEHEDEFSESDTYERLTDVEMEKRLEW